LHGRLIGLGERNTRLFQQPWTADQDRCTVERRPYALPGNILKVTHIRERDFPGAGLSQDRLRQGMLRQLLNAGSEAQ
jgi:hypothetical protein